MPIIINIMRSVSQKIVRARIGTCTPFPVDVVCVCWAGFGFGVYANRKINIYRSVVKMPHDGDDVDADAQRSAANVNHRLHVFDADYWLLCIFQSNHKYKEVIPLAFFSLINEPYYVSHLSSLFFCCGYWLCVPPVFRHIFNSVDNSQMNFVCRCFFFGSLVLPLSHKCFVSPCSRIGQFSHRFQLLFLLWFANRQSLWNGLIYACLPSLVLHVDRRRIVFIQTMQFTSGQGVSVSISICTHSSYLFGFQFIFFAFAR